MIPPCVSVPVRVTVTPSTRGSVTPFVKSPFISFQTLPDKLDGSYISVIPWLAISDTKGCVLQLYLQNRVNLDQSYLAN